MDSHYNNVGKLDPSFGFWASPAMSAPPSRCRSPMLSHSRSDGEFPIHIKQGKNYIYWLHLRCFNSKLSAELKFRMYFFYIYCCCKLVIIYAWQPFLYPFLWARWVARIIIAMYILNIPFYLYILAREKIKLFVTHIHKNPTHAHILRLQKSARANLKCGVKCKLTRGVGEHARCDPYILWPECVCA